LGPIPLYSQKSKFNNHALATKLKQKKKETTLFETIGYGRILIENEK
jgi:hypothetical protein